MHVSEGEIRPLGCIYCCSSYFRWCVFRIYSSSHVLYFNTKQQHIDILLLCELNTSQLSKTRNQLCISYVIIILEWLLHQYNITLTDNSRPQLQPIQL